MPTSQACPRCAKRQPSEARFCRRCGLALTARTAGPAVVPPPPRHAPAHAVNPVGRVTPQWPHERPAPARLLGMVGVVLLLFAALCLFLFLRMTEEPVPPIGPPAPVVTMPAGPQYPPAVRNPMQSPSPWPPGAGWSTPTVPAPPYPQVHPVPNSPFPAAPAVPAAPNYPTGRQGWIPADPEYVPRNPWPAAPAAPQYPNAGPDQRGTWGQENRQGRGAHERDSW